jgi:D-alanyl-D-alanine carboxypeptidase (penicillin-binding protein 5/6)
MSGLIVFLIVLTEIFGIDLSGIDGSKLYLLNSSQLKTNIELEKIDLSTVSSYPVKTDGYYKPDITADSFLVYDLGSNRTLAKKKADKKRPIASITKLMTAIIAIENMNPTEDVVKVPKNIHEVDGSKLWLNSGLRFKLNEIIKGMLVKSANDCAYVISYNYDKKYGKDEFKKLMNQKAQEIGMVDSSFDESTGLSEDNISTANDIKKMTNYALKKVLIKEYINLEEATITSQEGYQFQANASNQMLTTNKDIFGIKTGYLEEAGHCFVAGSKINDNNIVSIVLDAGSTVLRFSDSRKLIDWARQNYNW